MMLIWKLRVIVYWLKLKSVQLDYNCVIVITDEKFNGSQGWLYDSLHCIHLSYEIKYLVNLMGPREKNYQVRPTLFYCKPIDFVNCLLDHCLSNSNKSLLWINHTIISETLVYHRWWPYLCTRSKSNGDKRLPLRYIVSEASLVTRNTNRFQAVNRSLRVDNQPTCRGPTFWLVYSRRIFFRISVYKKFSNTYSEFELIYGVRQKKCWC